MPAPGTMITASPGYTPALIKGLVIHPENSLEFDFIVDSGDDLLTSDEIREQSDKMIRYFLASLTVPEEELWVNLSPYEKDRIIPPAFGQTEMGRDLLAQDYLLKQLTASLMYPKDALGERFWKRVYQKAFEKFGTTDIPMSTFNKIWIVPKSATIYEHEPSRTVFVLESSLEVMLEEDYVAMQNSIGDKKYGMENLLEKEYKEITGVTSAVVREVLLPEIEKEVNEGETFANLRQIYNSMILAAWYKANLKESLLGRLYVDQNKITGVNLDDPKAREEIYEQYLEAFKKGVYEIIKEDYDPYEKESIPRIYFSGGYVGAQRRADPDTGEITYRFLPELVNEDWTRRSSQLTASEDRAMLARVEADIQPERTWRVNASLVESDRRPNSVDVARQLSLSDAEPVAKAEFLRRAASAAGSPAAQVAAVPAINHLHEAKIAIDRANARLPVTPAQVDSLLEVAALEDLGPARAVLEQLRSANVMTAPQLDRFRTEIELSGISPVELPDRPEFSPLEPGERRTIARMTGPAQIAAAAAIPELRREITAITGSLADAVPLAGGVETRFSTYTDSVTGRPVLEANVFINDVSDPAVAPERVLADLSRMADSAERLMTGVRQYVEREGGSAVVSATGIENKLNDPYKTFGSVRSTLTRGGTELPVVVNFIARRPAAAPERASMSDLEIREAISAAPAAGLDLPSARPQRDNVVRALYAAGSSGQIDVLRPAIDLLGNTSPAVIRAADTYLNRLGVMPDQRREIYEQTAQFAENETAQVYAVQQLAGVGNRNSVDVLRSIESGSLHAPAIRTMAARVRVGLERALSDGPRREALSKIIVAGRADTTGPILDSLDRAYRGAAAEARDFNAITAQTADTEAGRQVVILRQDDMDLARQAADRNISAPVILVSAGEVETRDLPPNVVGVARSGAELNDIIDRLDSFNEAVQATGARAVSRATSAPLFERLNAHVPAAQLVTFPGVQSADADNYQPMEFFDQMTPGLQQKVDAFKASSDFAAGRPLKVMVAANDTGVTAMKAIETARRSGVPVDVTIVNLSPQAHSAAEINLDFAYGRKADGIQRRMVLADYEGGFDAVDREPFDIVIVNAPEVRETPAQVSTDPARPLEISQATFNTILASSRDALRPDGLALVSAPRPAISRAESDVAGLEEISGTASARVPERVTSTMALSASQKNFARARALDSAPVTPSRPQADYDLAAIEKSYLSARYGDQYLRNPGGYSLPSTTKANLRRYLQGEIELSKVVEPVESGASQADLLAPDEQTPFLRSLVTWRVNQLEMPSDRKRAFWDREITVAEKDMPEPIPVADQRGYLSRNLVMEGSPENLSAAVQRQAHHLQMIGGEIRELRKTYTPDGRSASGMQQIVRGFDREELPYSDGSLRAAEAVAQARQIVSANRAFEPIEDVLTSYLVGNVDHESFRRQAEAVAGKPLAPADVEWVKPVISQRLEKFFGEQSVVGPRAGDVPAERTMRELETRAFDLSREFTPAVAVDLLVNAERARIEETLGIEGRGVNLQRAQQAQVNHVINEIMLYRSVAQAAQNPDRAMFSIQNQIAASQNRDTVGGIDLNPAMLTLQIRRDGNGIPLPIDEQPLQNMNIQGFAPVIMNVTPVPSLPTLLGSVASPAGAAAQLSSGL